MKNSLAASLLASLALVACGGGGGDDDSGPVASTASFPARAAYAAYISVPQSDNFTVSGTCAGTATSTATAATPATFEGTTGRSVSAMITMNLPNCTPVSTSATAVSYFDMTPSPIGFNAGAQGYGVVAGPPPAIPVSVRVGDNGVFSTLTTYSSSTKQTVTGSRVLSYTVTADTADTVIVTFIGKDFNTQSQLTSTVQSAYRLTTAGVATLIFIDIQAAQTSTTHLRLTKN